MVRTLRVRIRFRRPSLPHCGQGAFLGPQGIGITTTVGASVPMLASLVRGGLSTTTFHQGACPNVQAQNGFEPPTIRWRSSRSLHVAMRIAEQPDILRLEAQRQPEADEAPCDHRERERHENENRPPDVLETVSNPIQQVEQ